MAGLRYNTAASNNNSGTDKNNDSWKAQGFLNLYLPNKDGKRTKLGAIPLKEANPNERQLLEFLKADPARVEVLLKNLLIEFRSAEPSAGSQFALE